MAPTPTRVVQVATGNAGRLTLRQLIVDERFELVGVSTSTADRVGVDAGALAGLDVTTGITAVGSLDELIALRPDVAVYCAMGDTRPVEATKDVCRLLEAGIDVVGSAPGAPPRTGSSRRSRPPRRPAAPASTSPGSTRVSPATCCRSRWPAPASGSSRSAATSSPTTRRTTAPR